jgi:copper homeostasis protein
MQAARRLRVPIYVLIRPRAGDFLYSGGEFETMGRDIRVAKDLGMDGIVLGLLDQRQRVDVKRTSELVKLARPLPVTFHRAFDQCRHLSSSLEAVIQTGAERILTSGGKARVTDGLPRLARLVGAAGDRIVVMPGGGVGLGNVRRILRQTAAREVHTSAGMSSLRSKHTSARTGAESRSRSQDSLEFEGRVRKIREALEAI